MKTVSSNMNGRKPESKWMPVIRDLATFALRGFVTGASVKLGGMAFDKTFKSNGTNLSMIKGGRSVANG